MTNTQNSEDLEQQLSADKRFQHILKFAPESQRELMTFELAVYIQELIVKARVDELNMYMNHYKDDYDNYISGRIAELQVILNKKEGEVGYGS